MYSVHGRGQIPDFMMQLADRVGPRVASGLVVWRSLDGSMKILLSDMSTAVAITVLPAPVRSGLAPKSTRPPSSSNIDSAESAVVRQSWRPVLVVSERK